MSTETQPCPFQKLVDSFHSLLDESLIFAIANDFDLHKSSGYEDAYTILQDLSQSVPSEEATGFDSSALHCFAGEEEAEARGDQIKDGSVSTPTASSERDFTSLDNKAESSSTSQAASDDVDSAEPGADLLNGQSEECKIRQLQGLFPDVKAFDVRHSLKKAKGDFQTALDDLLNIQYLQSTGQLSRGIDIFFNDEAEAGGSKKKRKGKAIGTRSTDQSSGSATPSDPLDEFKIQSEIANLADMLNTSFDEVSAFYRRANFSGTATVMGILDKHISHGGLKPSDGREGVDPTVTDGLRSKYRNIPDNYLDAIIQRTGAVPQFLDEIAAMVNKHFKQTKKQKFDMNYSLNPLPAQEIERGSWSLVSHKTARSSPKGFENYTQAAERSEACSQARRDAVSSAASLHRKGASNPLYRQAASVYAERASEQAGYAQEAMSTAADLLVEGQSTEDSIDLHGVSVQDGVRIARQKTRHWWETRGKFRGERRETHTFTIITGLGRHSASGVSQLRQSVAKALKQDGWKTSVETGRFVITGRQ